MPRSISGPVSAPSTEMPVLDRQSARGGCGYQFLPAAPAPLSRVLRGAARRGPGRHNRNASRRMINISLMANATAAKSQSTPNRAQWPMVFGFVGGGDVDLLAGVHGRQGSAGVGSVELGRFEIGMGARRAARAR